MQDPLQDPFIGIVKLETGEELIAQVHYSEDDNVLCLQNPMIVIEANSSDKSTMIKGFKLDLWIKSAMDPDEIFLVNPDRILTCTEANFCHLQVLRGEHSIRVPRRYTEQDPAY